MLCNNNTIHMFVAIVQRVPMGSNSGDCFMRFWGGGLLHADCNFLLATKDSTSCIYSTAFLSEKLVSYLREEQENDHEGSA